MRYNLANPFERQQAERRFRQLAERGAVVEITAKTPHSNSQRNYLHLLLSALGLHLGMTQRDVKYIIFKRIVNRDLFLEYAYNDRVGQFVERERSSEELTSEEMNLAIARFRDYAVTEFDFYLPSPEDREGQFWMEHEVERNKRWLNG